MEFYSVYDDDIDFSKKPPKDFFEKNVKSIIIKLSKEHRFANDSCMDVYTHTKLCLDIFNNFKLKIINHYPDIDIDLLEKIILLHDFTEAYVRDVPTSVKNQIGQAWFDMEDMVFDYILQSVGLSKSMITKEIQECLVFIDTYALYVEALTFFPDKEKWQRKMNSSERMKIEWYDLSSKKHNVFFNTFKRLCRYNHSCRVTQLIDGKNYSSPLTREINFVNSIINRNE